MTAHDTTLDKTFDPAAIEARWYAHWEENGLFRPARPDAAPFTIVNPPPNVTGSLHIGHALDNTLQDIVVRYERLRGKDALWVVGTDHAGIATQMVVERQMSEHGEKRTDYSREAFVDKVWAWKEESGGQITRQLRRLGCSMDWANERFTMDEGFTKAVIKVFVDLHSEGLIYRDKRLVNWDPKLKTAISDLEVENQEVNGHFWHFSYPLADGSGSISVATTRPETMLADMAVAVHPSDERYAALVARGAKVKLPITGREIPIVADEHADPELGSGAVKITPGHDFNDFEVGKRADIAPADMLNMLDAEARVVQTADDLIPAELIGLDRFEARKRVVAMIEAEGLLERVEDRVVMTPYGDRGGVVIEPWLTDQWYVDAEQLAGPAMDAVRSGAVEIVPKTWEKTFFNWMENIQPWCVSRQLWWGHRIPAWYGPPMPDEREYLANVMLGGSVKKLFGVAESFEALVARTREKYGDAVELYEVESEADYLAGLEEASLDNPRIPLMRDPDVLDTWFSSALWPFGTLGWPDETDKLAKHYPNDLLISGFDILFFWDARMLMQGIQFMEEAPWKRLYLHGLVRAADGSKMSKSKGNTIDPLGLIDTYGADALRFFMAAMESQGRDIKMDEGRVEGYRNFATKLWNAARFCQANGIGASSQLAAPEAALPVNRWIIGEVIECQATLDRAMAELRFDAAANSIYHFVWDRFCDWYLELIKPVLSSVTPANAGVSGETGSHENGDSGLRRNDEVEETKAVAGWVLDQILVMLHPFMPFITEELWNSMGERSGYPLITAKWPEPDAQVDAEAKAEIDWLIRLIGAVRSTKTELNIPPGTKMTAHIRDGDAALAERIERQAAALDRIGRLERLINDPAPAGAAAQIPLDGATYVLPLEGVIDIDAEKARLKKALEAAEKEVKSLGGRLNNANFLEKAKPEAVEKARADHATRSAEAERLRAALERLG